MNRRKRVKRSGRIARLRASAGGKMGRSIPEWAGRERMRRELLEEFRDKQPKRRITLYLDADVLAWFRSQGRRYQRVMNEALRRAMREEKKLFGS